MSLKTASGKPKVVDFSEARALKMDEKRRSTERIFFNAVLGVYSVTDGNKMKAIEMIDVSEKGCSFQVPFDSENPWPNDLKELPIRLYFSQETYLPLFLKIQHSRPAIQDGVRYMRYGCVVDDSLSSYEAYKQFVKFLKLYAQHAHKDTGDLTLFYL